MEKQSFQLKELYTKFLGMRKEGKLVMRWGFNSKARQLVKKSILTKRPPLRYHTDGLRVFVDVTECPSKEKLTQLKVTNSSTYRYCELPCSIFTKAQKRNFQT